MSATVPILFLSTRDSDFDIVAGLRLGADDYLTKDVSLPHLSARIAALFRRSDLLAAPHAVCLPSDLVSVGSCGGLGPCGRDGPGGGRKRWRHTGGGRDRVGDGARSAD